MVLVPTEFISTRLPIVIQLNNFSSDTMHLTPNLNFIIRPANIHFAVWANCYSTWII